MGARISSQRIVVMFAVLAILLVLLFFISVSIGSLKVSPGQLVRGLFVEYDEQVATVYDLRFPRILIAMFAGASLAASGALLQAVMKNPVADPGIIGISAGAGFFAVLITAFFPVLFFMTPLFAICGGLAAFALVYSLAWSGGINPVRIILVGIAVSVVFSGLSEALNSFSGGNLSGVASIVNGNITMKTWSDVRLIASYSAVGLLLAALTARHCNLMALDDRTVRSLGINVNRSRIVVSLIAVALASVSAAVVGVVGFLGLCAPHIARLIVGNEHKALIPFSMLTGAFMLLLVDTLGRTIAAPYEIPAGVLMAVFGGPCFIILLRKRGKEYGN